MARTSIWQRRGGWRARPPDRTCLLASLAGPLCRRALLIALHRTNHALAVRRNATVLHLGGPRVDHLGRGIDVLGVAGAECDRVAAVKILRAFVAVGPATGSGCGDH